MSSHSSGLAARTAYALAGAVLLGPSSVATADTLQIFADNANSTEGLGDFTGTLSYEFVVGQMGGLIVDLTNTSEPDNGGWITGFIFNIGSIDPDVSATLTGSTHPFENAPDQNGAPFGNPYLAGAALGGDWLGGGLASDGIPVGDAGSFTFDVFASDASSLTAMSFLQGPYDFNFLVRFRGFENGGSDKVPAVPAPGALALLGLGALAQRRRRRPA